MGSTASKNSLGSAAWDKIYSDTCALQQVSMAYNNNTISFRFDIPDQGVDITAGTLMLCDAAGTKLFSRGMKCADVSGTLAITAVPQSWITEFMHLMREILNLRVLQYVYINAPYNDIIVFAGVLYMCSIIGERLHIKRVLHGCATDITLDNFTDNVAIPGWQWIKRRIILSLAKHHLTSSQRVDDLPKPIEITSEHIKISWYECPQDTHAEQCKQIESGHIQCRHAAIEDYASLACDAMPLHVRAALCSLPLHDWTILAIELPLIQPTRGELQPHEISGTHYRVTPNYVLMHDGDEFMWSRRDQLAYRRLEISRDELQTLLREHMWVEKNERVPAAIAIINAIRQLDGLPWKQLDSNQYDYLRLSGSSQTFLPLDG